LVFNGFGRNGEPVHWHVLTTLDSCYRVPDLSLAVQHPKRAFIRRVIEFEIRLAYHERIFKTLPPPMQEPDAFVISEQAPAPAFEYEDPCKSIRRIFRL